MKHNKGGAIGSFLGCAVIVAVGLWIIFAIGHSSDSSRSAPSTSVPASSAPVSVAKPSSSDSVANPSLPGNVPPATATPAAKAPLRVPDEESELISTVASFKPRYEEAPNEFQKSSIRRQRAQSLARILPDRGAVDWIGTISSMQTTSDGSGIIELTLPGNNSIKMRTRSNGFSDIGAGTLIPAGSRLYDEIAHLSVGQEVVFSGKFAVGDLDYLGESSLTEAGSMDAPEFIFRFSQVRPAGSESVSTPLNQITDHPAGQAPTSNIPSVPLPNATVDVPLPSVPDSTPSSSPK